MKIAITGSTGHIAASLIPLLVKKGSGLRALIYDQEPAFDLSAIEIVKGNISDPSSLDNLVTGCEITIHCAAKISINSNNDPSVYETNVNGTMNIFNASKKAGVKKFIHVSSIHAYHQLPSNELLNEFREYCSDKAPRYDQSKRDAEKFVLQQASSQMEAVVLNPTGVIGPLDHKPSLMGQAIMDLYNKKIPSLINGGFDFCDVRDVADGIMQAIDKGRNAHSYLLSGQWVHMAELNRMIMDVKGEKRTIPVLPAWTGYLGLPFIELIAKIKKQQPLYTKESLYTLIHGNKKISCAKAADELGYSCRPLAETITDSINWYKQVGMLN